MSDREKHDYCRERTGQCAVFLPPALYDAAEREGFDMRWYVKQTTMPTGAPSDAENAA